jgi:hypothetical protein
VASQSTPLDQATCFAGSDAWTRRPPRITGTALTLDATEQGFLERLIAELERQVV